MPKALKTWYATSALIFPAVGTFYLAGDLSFVDTGTLAAQFTNFGRPATFGLLIATILTVTALYLAYALIRRTGRSPSRLRRQGDTVRRRHTMTNGAAGILLIDDTGFVLDTNPAAKKIFGAGARDCSPIPDAIAPVSDAPAAGVRRGFYLDIQA